METLLSLAELKSVIGRKWEDLMRPYSENYMEDMEFLNSIVWPLFQENDAYCLDSVSCDKYPSSHPFTLSRKNSEHIGMVIMDDVPRESDVYVFCIKG